MTTASIDKTNAACGVFFIVCGLLFAWQSSLVELGSWIRIGPGGLPLVLSVLLVLLGVVLLVQALRTAGDGEGAGVIPWRGMLFILVAPILFGLIVRGVGFIGAVFLTALFASFASHRMTLLRSLALAVALTIFSNLVFSYGLGLPFERVGPWLRF